MLRLSADGSGQFDTAEKMITDNRVLFHRVANTLNYLDIKTVVVSCGTCYDQLQSYQFEAIFPGCRIVDIHEYLLEKGTTCRRRTRAPRGYLYHDPCHSPMKLQDPDEDRQGAGRAERTEERPLLRESGTLGVTRPDISTQVRYRKERRAAQGRGRLRARPAACRARPVKILTSCPSCLQGLSRYGDDLAGGLLEADYIVVEMARRILENRTG